MEVNEGENVFFSIAATSDFTGSSYGVTFNINETGGEHFPEVHSFNQPVSSNPITFPISTNDDNIDEADSTVIISIDISNPPSGFGLRNRTVTVLIRDNDRDEEFGVGMELVDENGVPYGQNISDGITEGDQFMARVFIQDGHRRPPTVPVVADVRLNVRLANRIDGALSSAGNHDISITIPAGETSATSQLYTITDDNTFSSDDLLMTGFISSTDSALYTPDFRILYKELYIFDADPPVGEVFYTRFVDGNVNDIPAVVEGGDPFYIRFEADNSVSSPVTLTYSMVVRADHIAGFPKDEPQTRTVTVARDESSALAGPFTTIDDSQRDLPTNAEVKAILLPGAGYSVAADDDDTMRLYDNDAFPGVRIFVYKGSDRETARGTAQTNVTEGEDLHIRVEFTGLVRIPRSFDVPVSFQIRTFGNLFEGFAPDEVREATLTIPAGETGAEMTLRTTDNNLRDDTINKSLLPSEFPDSWCASRRPGIESGDRCGGALFVQVHRRPDIYNVTASTINHRAVVVDNDPDAAPANPEYTIIPTASSPVIEGEDNAVIRFDIVPPELEADITFTVSINTVQSGGEWFGHVDANGDVCTAGFIGAVTLTAGLTGGSCSTSTVTCSASGQDGHSPPCYVNVDDSGATLTVEVRDNQKMSPSSAYVAPVTITERPRTTTGMPFPRTRPKSGWLTMTPPQRLRATGRLPSQTHPCKPILFPQSTKGETL